MIHIGMSYIKSYDWLYKCRGDACESSTKIESGEADKKFKGEDRTSKIKITERTPELHRTGKANRNKLDNS